MTEPKPGQFAWVIRVGRLRIAWKRPTSRWEEGVTDLATMVSDAIEHRKPKRKRELLEVQDGKPIYVEIVGRCGLGHGSSLYNEFIERLRDGSSLYNELMDESLRQQRQEGTHE